MKKQKNKKANWMTIIFFVFLLIMGIYAIYLSFESVFNNEPEFKITTEKCFKDMIQNNTAEAKYDVLSSQYSELMFDFKRENCDILEKYNISDKEEICVYLDKELKDINKQMSINTKTWIYYEDVCEQVEVDNLRIFLGEYDVLYTNDKFCKEGWFKQNISSYNETSGIIYDVEVCFRESLHEFLKEDLTIGWLDENCEVKQFDRELSEDELKDVRGIYQCQEYEVRILK